MQDISSHLRKKIECESRGINESNENFVAKNHREFPRCKKVIEIYQMEEKTIALQKTCFVMEGVTVSAAAGVSSVPTLVCKPKLNFPRKTLF